MGLPGKPKGFDEGKIKEIAEYCETDVVGTYQVWLRYELFCGRLTQNAFEASQRNLADFMNARSNIKERLSGMSPGNLRRSIKIEVAQREPARGQSHPIIIERLVPPGRLSPEKIGVDRWQRDV